MTGLFVLLALLAQAGPPKPQSPMKENLAPVPAQSVPTKLPLSRGVDHIFAVVTMQGNNAELEMAQLALRRGTANEVLGFAGKMISEHEGLMKEMQPALERVVVTAPPERLAPPDTLALLHLESISPVDFDQEYALQQLGDHLATITAFQTEADNGTDPQLKALAKKWLPTIKAHLELAVDLTQHIGGSSPFKSH